MKEGHKLQAHINTAFSQHPTALTALAWTQRLQKLVPPPRQGEWHQPGPCSSLPSPAKLSGWTREMTVHVSRWQRWV